MYALIYDHNLLISDPDLDTYHRNALYKDMSEHCYVYDKYDEFFSRTIFLNICLRTFDEDELEAAALIKLSLLDYLKFYGEFDLPKFERLYADVNQAGRKYHKRIIGDDYGDLLEQSSKAKSKMLAFLHRYLSRGV